MSPREQEIVIQRILVALDASPQSQAALDAAAQLAARLSAELQGLFVEDVNLLRLAELPFTREVGFSTTARRRLEAQDLERQLRARARRLQQRFTAIAERNRLQWSFRVARGAISSELLAASSDVDLVILGKSGWSHHRRRRLGSTARAVVAGAPALTLILQEGTCLGLPVLAVYDGSQLADRALAAAAFLARFEEGPVTVVLQDHESEVEELQSRADAQLRKHGVRGRYRVLSRTSVLQLALLVRTKGCGTLVLPSKSALLQDEMLRALLDEMDVPTLFVR
jgi:nucleotide-binding universal stress UspA family protein